MSSPFFIVVVLALAAVVCSTPIEEPVVGYNASHAVARGLVERASDYYCQTHCAGLCDYHPGWCCGVDDCHYGSQNCACYNYCFCGGSGFTYRCSYCDL